MRKKKKSVDKHKIGASIDFDLKTGSVIHRSINVEKQEEDIDDEDQGPTSSSKSRSPEASCSSDPLMPNMGDIVKEHREFARGRGVSIQAGLFAGLVNHGVDDALKVTQGCHVLL